MPNMSEHGGCQVHAGKSGTQRGFAVGISGRQGRAESAEDDHVQATLSQGTGARDFSASTEQSRAFARIA